MTEKFEKEIDKINLYNKKNPTKQVLNCNTMEIFKSVKQASDKYNLYQENIVAVCLNKKNDAGGYKWMYYDNYKEEHKNEHTTTIINTK